MHARWILRAGKPGPPPAIRGTAGTTWRSRVGERGRVAREAHQLHQSRGTAIVQCGDRGGVALLRQSEVHVRVRVLAPRRRRRSIGSGGDGRLTRATTRGRGQEATRQGTQHSDVLRKQWMEQEPAECTLV